MPFRLLSNPQQERLGRSTVILPAFVFIFCLLICFIVGVEVQKNEVRSENATLRAESKEFSKQLELTAINNLLRVQSTIEVLNPDNHLFLRETDIIETMLSNTIFRRVSHVRFIGYSPADGLPEFEIKSTIRTKDDERVLPQYNKIRSTTIRKKMSIMMTQSLQKSFAINSSTGTPTFTLIWRSAPGGHDFHIYTLPVSKMFDDGPKNNDLVSVLYDPDTHLKLQITWNSNSEANVSSDPVKIAELEKSSTLLVAPSDSFSPFSTLKLYWYKVPGLHLNPLAWTIWLAGILISGLLAIFLRFILDQNRRVSELVVNRTIELESALDEAVEAGLAKTRFLANMSHELRTPLNIILGMIELIEEKSKEPKVLEFVRSMRVSSDHLLNLITELLSAAQDQHHDNEIKSIPIKCPTFFEEIGMLSGADCRRKGLNLSIYIDPQLPETFRGDPARLRQILINLMRNSVKYTNSGGIQLKVTKRNTASDDPQNVSLRIVVSDSGIGIPAAKQSKIFDRFFQLDSTTLLSEGGVGLGLSIVRELVADLNGDIRVQSKPGEGSDFIVDLDFVSMQAKPWFTNYQKDTLNIKKVILITDSKATQSLLEYYLAQLETQVNSYTLSEIETNKIESHRGTTFIFDLNSKGPNREELLKSLPEETIYLDPGFKKVTLTLPNRSLVLNSTPLIPTTFFPAIGVRSSRPVVPTGPFSISQSQSPQPSESSTNSLRILIADDDKGNLYLYESYFSDFGWILLTAENGEQAWEIFKSQPVDIVIADLRMPVMDGIELMDRIRSSDRKMNRQETPIILVTANALDETEALALKHGANQFLTKPVSKAKIINAILALHKKKTSHNLEL